MLREAAFHTDPCDMTMSMMREKQYEACERRLLAHPRVALFSEEATDTDAQALYEHSYAWPGKLTRLVTLKELRRDVRALLPVESLYISLPEREILERLILHEGEMVMTDWDDIGAAESLVRRLWCGFRAEGEEWILTLPKELIQPLMKGLNSSEQLGIRERCFRYDATIHGLLYLTGLLHAAQAQEFFLTHVMRVPSPRAVEIARRYMQVTFEYILDENGEMVLLHPGLVNPYQLVKRQEVSTMGAFEMSQTMMAGGMNGILPEEIPLHEKLCFSLRGAMRPDYDLNEAAEDLRMLAKQGVSLEELEDVLSSLLAVMPTPEMLGALRQLYEGTPRWLGLKAALEH